MRDLIILFAVCSLVNVVLNTFKSLATINGGKFMASFMNALTYGFYTYVIILTNCELPMMTKCLLTASTNFLGVYIVKFIEEKTKKDKLWKVDLTVNTQDKEKLEQNLKDHNIPYNYTLLGKHTMFSTFCNTQKETQKVVNFGKMYNAKFFASKCETLLL